jgi:hypothetical protein
LRQPFVVTSPRNYLLVFLALTTLGGVVLAWNQHLEIIELNAALQEKELDAQLHQREFDTKLAVLQAKARKKAAADDDAAAQNLADTQPPRGRFGNMRAMMNDPNLIKLMALQQKARLDSTYAPLFKQLTQQLNISPAQLAAFQNLLVQKQSAARDAVQAARDQGLNPATDRDEIAQLVAQSNDEIDQQIQSTLGPQAYAQYQGYEQTLPERNTVTQLQQGLSYTSSPLTDAQSQQLIQLLAANAPQSNSNPTSLRALFGGGGNTPITDADIAQASGFLSPDQVAALQQQQTTQKAAADLARSLRNAAQGNAPAPAGAAPTTGAQAGGP